MVFSTYVVLLSIAVLRHEPWFDEAQAWLLARDSNLYDLLVKYMRYEGSPALWHLILFIPAKLQLPYKTLNIISGLIAASSVFLFIRYSPFPTIIKVLYPFTYFAFYQYAVVARSYALIPLLLFLIAMAYDKKIEKPYIYILLTCLLANVSLHGLIIAMGLVFLHFIDLIRGWAKTDRFIKQKNFIAFSLFNLVFLLLVFQLIPASDIITFADFNRDITKFYTRSINILSDALLTNGALNTPGKKLLYKSLDIYVKFIIVLSLLWFMARRKFLTFAIPLAGLMTLFILVYSNLWHHGVIFYTWLFVLWLTYKDKELINKQTKALRALVTLSITLLLAGQIYWSYHTFMFDNKYNYSASRDVAEYIKNNNLENKKIYVTGFYSIAILPYFKDNIFCNFHNNEKPSFWLWSSKNNIYSEPYLYISRYKPDYIIMGVKKYYRKLVLLNQSMLPLVPGYKLVKCFDGGLFWKDSIYETDSYALYEKLEDN